MLGTEDEKGVSVVRLRSIVCRVGAVSLLVSCAGHATQPVALTSPLSGQYETGHVVAVRSINVEASADAVQNILTVLHTPGGPIPDGQAEVIIRKEDGSITSIVEPSSPIVKGERIAILEAATTVLRPE
ncbi:MAG TPA: hypothetical protein PLY97_08780 [Acidocella sp.]|nr:MAG: hypothetical protein B7Z81_01365 [Acidocella sp. 20-61-6]HQT47300.1 hypothetical protein [Acidocella sp.]